MSILSRTERERERRETVERYHILKDREEDFAASKASATSPEQLQQMIGEFESFRREHRERDVERGKRAPGFGVLMHQIMWALWVEIAADHTLAAQHAYEEIRSGDTGQLAEEMRQSLVAVAASASTVEALYEDVKYLIPERGHQDTAAERIADLLATVFGLPEGEADALFDQLAWLFNRRNEAVHPYAEPEAPQPHPSGESTSAEASRFNAVESRAALEIALFVLGFAESPPQAANRWVGRWSTERGPYFEGSVAAVRSRVAGT